MYLKLIFNKHAAKYDCLTVWQEMKYTAIVIFIITVTMHWAEANSIWIEKIFAYNCTWVGTFFTWDATEMKLYLHFVLFRTIYYYHVAVWFMRPYFRRYVTLIVDMMSQYKSTPQHTMNSFVTSYRLSQPFLKIATHSED
jgi:hypothetical protein